MSNFQREGAVSNAHVGRDFELLVQSLLADEGLHLEVNHKVDCGLHECTKPHSFDLGADHPKVIVECKSHTWTASGNVPSAKITTWVEAMFYFHMAPSNYRKLFVAARSLRKGYDEPLLAYFARTKAHLIPKDVELWELDEASSTLVRLDGEARE
ncbi:hypothetical protein ACRAQ6_11965 [Erythrobacter sp. HA6-11]